MNKLSRLLALTALSSVAFVSARAGTFSNITLNGDFTDWNGITAAYTDASGDGAPGDIHQIFIANNDTHLFIRVTFHSAVNPNSGNSLFIGVDNDSNAATGYDVYSLGLVGTEAGWQNDFPFEQATGVFNTNATTSNAAAAIAPYFTVTTQQEIGISRAAIIDTANSQLVFPNLSFNLAVYFNGGTTDDFAGPVSYTFAAAPIPEPSSVATLAGLGVLGLVALRRRR